jgi:RNA recognition motif-containing protein
VFYPELACEPECRLIQISNVDPQTTHEDLKKIFSVHGELEAVDVSKVQLGIASVKFYDLQAAMKARQSRITLRGKNLILMFGPQDPIPNPRKPPNNGTIVVFHLRKGVSDDLIREEFSQFGEIRQIRSAPAKQAQRFVEFWDTRAAEQALKAMKGRRVFDSKISVEFSLPGGFRKTQTQISGPRLPTIERVSHYSDSRAFC